jgi:ABC-type multidrug transport system ATPase subunit
MYNGKEVNPSTPLYQRAYISQYDLHHAEMTVRETIDFSSKMLGTNGEFGKAPSHAHRGMFANL